MLEFEFEFQSDIMNTEHSSKPFLKTGLSYLFEMLLWQLNLNVQSFVPHDGHVLWCYSAMKTTLAYT